MLRAKSWSALTAIVLVLGCGTSPSPPATPDPDAGLPPIDAAPDAAIATPRLRILDSTGLDVAMLRYAAPFVVRAEGLPPGATATITGAMADYLSSASFRVADDGTVDVSRDAPLEGTYSGVDADGLVWSMHRDGTDSITDYAIDFVVHVDDIELARARIDRRPLDEGAVHHAVTDDGLVAELWLPPTAGPHPVVVTFGGSEGGIGTARREAAYFTSLGWAAFAVAYFGETGLPASLGNIPLEYFDRALEWIAAQPEIDPARLVLWGVSRGGELVLQLGADSPLVRGVIAAVPSGLRHPSVDGSSAAWIRTGVSLPWLQVAPGAVTEWVTLPDGEHAQRLTPFFETSLDHATTAELDAATIAIDRVAGPVILLGAGDDGLWPSCRMSDFAWNRLVSSGHTTRYADQNLCLPDAGHFMTGPPGWPTEGTTVYRSPLGRRVMGGTPAGNARAQRAIDTMLRVALASPAFGG